MTPGLRTLQRLQHLRNERTVTEATEALIQLRLDFMHTIMLNKSKTTEFLSHVQKIQFHVSDSADERLVRQCVVLQQSLEKMINDIVSFTGARKNPILPTDTDPDDYDIRLVAPRTALSDEALESTATEKQADDLLFVSEAQLRSLYLQYASKLKAAYAKLFPGKIGASDQVLKLVLVAIGLPTALRAQYYMDLSNKVNKMSKIPEVYHGQQNVSRQDLIEVRRMMEAIFPRDTLLAPGYTATKEKKIMLSIPSNSDNPIRNFAAGVVLVKDGASTPFKRSTTRRDVKVVSTSFAENAPYEADAYQVRDFFDHYNRAKSDAEYRTETGISRSDNINNLDETLKERLRPVADLIRRRRRDASRLEALALDLLIQGENAPTKSADVLNRRRRMTNRFRELLDEQQEKK